MLIYSPYHNNVYVSSPKIVLNYYHSNTFFFFLKTNNLHKFQRNNYKSQENISISFQDVFHTRIVIYRTSHVFNTFCEFLTINSLIMIIINLVL